jgi:hypothetical protein
MHIEASGTAIFKIIETDELVHVRANELDWNNEGDGEGQMGDQTIHSAELQIGGHSVAWKIYEYPIGVENYKETEYEKDALSLIQDIEYWLEHDPED